MTCWIGKKYKINVPRLYQVVNQHLRLLERSITIKHWLLLPDEPTASLDMSDAYQKITEMLAAIAHEQGRGVGMITYDLVFLIRLIVFMHHEQ